MLLSHERPEAGSRIAWHICAMPLQSGGRPGREMTRAGASASARLARIASAVRAHAPARAERDGTYFEAAVALILRETVDGEVELLFIKRAARGDDPWSGQIALPGGRHQASDQSLEDTAVRETLEEVGLELRPAKGFNPGQDLIPVANLPTLKSFGFTSSGEDMFGLDFRNGRFLLTVMRGRFLYRFKQIG